MLETEATHISLLGATKYDGSSVRVGVPYQNIGSIQGNRNNSEMRANRINELVPVKDKTVLDLGCNVGTISNRLAELGATVVGVDHDADSIAVAREMNSKAMYACVDINLEYIRSLPHFDVVVWLSQFMWLVKQHGMDYALDCLWELGKHCDTLVFETAGRDDGSAPIPYAQSDIFALLCKNTIFTDITDHGQWNDMWTPRNVFVLKNPLVLHDSFFSCVFPTTRGLVKKHFKDYEYARQMKARYSQVLSYVTSPYLPKLVAEDHDSLTLSWEGPRSKFISDDDANGILECLGPIKHRDIRPDNVLFNGQNSVLIDFTFASFPGEITNVSHDLGGKYKCPNGFNDEYSLRKVQQELLK